MDPTKDVSQGQAKDEASTLETKAKVIEESEDKLDDTVGDSHVPTTISPEDKLLLRDKMKDLFAGFITNIDNHVLDVGKSQCELSSQLDKLIETLDSIKIDEKLTTDISENAKRISTLKSRLTVIHTILSDVSARCGRTLAACGAALQNTSATATDSSTPATSTVLAPSAAIKTKPQETSTDDSP